LWQGFAKTQHVDVGFSPVPSNGNIAVRGRPVMDVAALVGAAAAFPWRGKRLDQVANLVHSTVLPA